MCFWTLSIQPDLQDLFNFDLLPAHQDQLFKDELFAQHEAGSLAARELTSLKRAHELCSPATTKRRRVVLLMDQVEENVDDNDPEWYNVEDVLLKM